MPTWSGLSRPLDDDLILQIRRNFATNCKAGKIESSLSLWNKMELVLHSTWVLPDIIVEAYGISVERLGLSRLKKYAEVLLEPGEYFVYLMRIRPYQE